MQATINDVARTAGVSKATVSKYLNGSHYCLRRRRRRRSPRPSTDLGYSPNRVAQGLSLQAEPHDRHRGGQHLQSLLRRADPGRRGGLRGAWLHAPTGQHRRRSEERERHRQGDAAAAGGRHRLRLGPPRRSRGHPIGARRHAGGAGEPPPARRGGRHGAGRQRAGRPDGDRAPHPDTAMPPSPTSAARSASPSSRTACAAGAMRWRPPASWCRPSFACRWTRWTSMRAPRPHAGCSHCRSRRPRSSRRRTTSRSASCRACDQLGHAVPDRLAIVGFDNVPFGEIALVPLTSVDGSGRVIGQRAMRLLIDSDRSRHRAVLAQRP